MAFKRSAVRSRLSPPEVLKLQGFGTFTFSCTIRLATIIFFAGRTCAIEQKIPGQIGEKAFTKGNHLDGILANSIGTALPGKQDAAIFIITSGGSSMPVENHKKGK
jgi:hypothetical protein